MSGAYSIPLASGSQVVLVTVPSLTATEGSLQLFSRTGNSWNTVGTVVRVRCGKGGLAWAQRPADEKGPEKVEGDGRTPIGTFSLGPVFGYGKTPPDGCILPYRQATDHSFWVDDPQAPEYNQWVTLKADEPVRWQSAERMRRDDHQYRLGVVVEYNTAPATSGRGSAIFLHIWKNPDAPTEGCVAMEEGDLATLIARLDPGKDPQLVVRTTP